MYMYMLQASSKKNRESDRMKINKIINESNLFFLFRFIYIYIMSQIMRYQSNMFTKKLELRHI